MFDRTRLHTGENVCTSDGHKIGSITYIGADYLHVPTGFLGLGPDLYIPFSAVDRVEDDTVYLNVSRDDLRAREGTWKQRPTERAPSVTPEELRGKELYTSDNRDIGRVAGVGPDYLEVTTGIAGLGNRLFVPIDAIDRCTRDRCYANVSYDRLQSMGWNQPRRIAAAGGPMPAGRTYRIPLVEEEIEVHRHREQVGEVVIQKDVVEEQRRVDVPVSHEEVRIERHEVDRPVTEERPFERTEREIHIPVYEERVDVEKRPYVHEEIVVTPEQVTREEHVTETVRREVPRVKTTGEADEYVEGEEKLAEDVERKRRERRAGE